jgi:hypothetical protein
MRNKSTALKQAETGGFRSRVRGSRQVVQRRSAQKLLGRGRLAAPLSLRRGGHNINFVAPSPQIAPDVRVTGVATGIMRPLLEVTHVPMDAGASAFLDCWVAGRRCGPLRAAAHD